MYYPPAVQPAVALLRNATDRLSLSESEHLPCPFQQQWQPPIDSWVIRRLKMRNPLCAIRRHSLRSEIQQLSEDYLRSRQLEPFEPRLAPSLGKKLYEHLLRRLER